MLVDQSNSYLTRRARKRLLDFTDDKVEKENINSLKRKTSEQIVTERPKSRKGPVEKKVSFTLLALRSLDGMYEKFFKVYKDRDLGLDFSRIEGSG